jgi:hypothetical protein
LARVAELAELPLGQLVSQLSGLGIAVVNGPAPDALQSIESIEQSLTLS